MAFCFWTSCHCRNKQHGQRNITGVNWRERPFRSKYVASIKLLCLVILVCLSVSLKGTSSEPQNVLLWAWNNKLHKRNITKGIIKTWPNIIIIIVVIIIIRYGCLLSQAFSSWYFSWTSGDPQSSGFKFHTAVISAFIIIIIYCNWVVTLWQ